MGIKSFLGEFEHMVLLAVLQLKSEAHGPQVANLLEQATGREISRGALYSALRRLETKGYLKWRIEGATMERRGHPKRLFSVTKSGLEALRNNRSALLLLWKGQESVLAQK